MILSKENLQHVKGAGILVPEISLFELPERVLQFGTGVLLRALPDYFIDKANRRGIFNGRIVVVKSTSNGGISTFEQQNNLYTLCIRGIEDGKTVEENIISSAISRVITADQDWLSVLEFAQHPELKVIISNTTEVGIALVKERIDQNPPASFPAKLLAVLFERYKKFKGHSEGGLVVIPTELVPDNGKKLESIVQELAIFNELGDAFLSWLDLNVEFCSSLVDRIVPGKPDPATLAALEKELGYQDQLLSMAEPYRLWAIEGSKHAASLLSFSEADPGVVVTDDIERFRELKVRLLNGTHTLSCGIAVLAEIDTVKNGMTDPLLSAYIKALMELEIGPAIPYKIDKEAILAFSNTVADRFANPFIEHQWINITVQYSMKMKIRILPLLLNYQQLFQKVPQHIAFGFAAFLFFMKSEEKDGKYYSGSEGLHYLINDDSAAYFHGKLQAAPSEQAYLDAIFNDTEFWGTDLNMLKGFKEAVSAYYRNIQQDGVKNALQKELISGKRGVIL